jgi:hypothetical protein
MADLTINDLSADTVQQSEEFLIQFLKDQYPSLDLTEGRVLRNLLIRPAAIFHALNQTNIDQLRQSMSLQAIEENPSIATESTVDAVLSNYRVTRDQGSKSKGQIVIVIRDLVATTINAGTVFLADGLVFTNLLSFVGVTTQAVIIDDTNRLITKRTDGYYSFVIDVEAAEVGPQYDIMRNTRLTTTGTIPNLIDIYTLDNFSGGRSQESNQDLIDRFQQGITPPVFSGRNQIEALMRETVAGLKQVSIIGFNDAEMQRDRHNLFAISTGGKADIYAQTAAVPAEVILTKQAVLVDAENSIWQVSIGRDDAPGYYKIISILPENSSLADSSFEVLSEVRGLDLTPDGSYFTPEIFSLIEGAYSRYQTAVIRFVDTTPLTDNTSSSSSSSSGPVTVLRNYSVRVLAMPYIRDLQNLANTRSVRNPQADYLVRAPIPIFCTIDMTINYKFDSDIPDINAVKQSLADRVANLGFDMGQLPASIVFDAVQSAMATRGTLTISPLDMLGIMRKPTGELIQLRSANALVVPDLPEEEITSRTTIFYLPADSISVTLAKLNALPV